MAYDEEQQHRSRVVVETPTSRREVSRTETARVPERQGMSGAMVAALVVGAVALVTIIFLFLMSNQQNTMNDNQRVATTAPAPAQQPVIVQQPAPQSQQPIVVQAPPAATQPAPVIVEQPAPAAPASGTDDSTIQSNIDRKMLDDRELATLGILASVSNGKVTLTGAVNSSALKTRAERVVRAVKGVSSVDNQITVNSTRASLPE